MLQTSTLKFLQQLSKHNEKTWFDAHRDAYESARKDFSSFVQDVLDAHSQKDEDLSTLKAKDCIFRINRDIRFSKNKAPYKNNFGASLDRGGRNPYLPDTTCKYSPVIRASWVEAYGCRKLLN